jgi:hypothetical protein
MNAVQNEIQIYFSAFLFFRKFELSLERHWEIKLEMGIISNTLKSLTVPPVKKYITTCEDNNHHAIETYGKRADKAPRTLCVVSERRRVS